MSDYKDSSSMRYFLASLKPFARPLFWLPLGLFSLSLIAYWLYQQNPEWLGSVLDQPQISLEEEDTPTNEITNTPAATSLPPTVNPANKNTTLPNSPTSTAPFNPFNTNNINTNTNNPQKPSLFAPLMPPVKQNTAPTTSKSLQPIQIRPITGDSSNYPLQREIENRSRISNLNNSPNPNLVGNPNQVPIQSNPPYQNFQPTPYGNNPNPSQVPYSTNQPNYYQPPVYQTPVYGNQSNVNSYPNQGIAPNYNGAIPNQVPPQNINRGFTIQQPIDARSPDY
jgi:hypothetical protein